MSQKHKIIEFEERYRKEIIDLWKTCDLTRPWNDPDKDIDRKMKVDPELFLVGLINNKIVASVMGGYDGHRGWANYLAVDPDYQRLGLGQEIMEAVEALIRQRELEFQAAERLRGQDFLSPSDLAAREASPGVAITARG